MKQWFLRHWTLGNHGTVIPQKQETKGMSPRTALAYCLEWVFIVCAERVNPTGAQRTL